GTTTSRPTSTATTPTASTAASVSRMSRPTWSATGPAPATTRASSGTRPRARCAMVGTTSSARCRATRTATAAEACRTAGHGTGRDSGPFSSSRGFPPSVWTTRGGSEVGVVRPALAGAAMDQLVGIQHVAGRDRRLPGEARVDRREVRLGRGHQLLEAVDDEVGLLVGIDAVARAHDPLEVEADAVGRIALQAVDGLALARDDAAAVDAQPVVLADQAELDRVPVQPREVD